jgi:hypothetical protein
MSAEFDFEREGQMACSLTLTCAGCGMPVDKQKLASNTQWLQDALKENSGDPDLDCLSSLLDAQNEGHSADPPKVVQAKDSVSAAVEMQRLVGLKQAVFNLLQDNEKYVESLEKALFATKKVGQDLDEMELCLEHADIAEDEDEITDILPLQAERVRLPMYPNIYQQTPLLASQSEEVEQLRLLVCTFPWSNDEAARLKNALLKQCLRIATLQLAHSTSCPEDLLEVSEKMTEDELCKISSSANTLEKGLIDWSDIADRVGGTHTAEECRTRWLMVDRPGIQKTEWTLEEIDKLKGILQKHIKQSKDGVIRNWEIVAQELDSARLGIDCFMKSQQEDLVPAFTFSSARAWSKVPVSDKEREVAINLHSIWNDEAIVAARLGTGRPREQIANHFEANKPVKKFKWSGRADNALVVYVAKECKLKRSQLLAQLDSLSKIDFSKDYRLRPPNSSARAVERRWNHIKAEHKKGSSTLLNGKKAS